MPLRLDNANALPTCPQQTQQKQKRFKPRFKVDHAAPSMPENLPARTPRTGRDQIGRMGDIVSEAPGDFTSVHPGDFVGIRIRRHQAGTEASLGNRADHRTHEGRWSPRPMSSQRPPGRRRKRHPQRRRSQSPPRPRLAEGFDAPHPARLMDRIPRLSRSQRRFLTGDSVGSWIRSRWQPYLKTRGKSPSLASA